MTDPVGVRIHVEDVRFRSFNLGRPGRSARGEAPVLAGTIYAPADAAPVRSPGLPPLPGLVVGHGAGSNRRRHAPFCRAACAAGIVVLAFDFRGHGESSGWVDGPLELDVLAASALVRSHPLVDRLRVGYRGSSMGGFYGLRAAPDADFAALALLCPADEAVLLSALAAPLDTDALAARGLGLRVDVERTTSYLEASDTLDLAARVTSPVLLVHARGDAVVPLRTSLSLAAALEGPVDVAILPDGDHGSAQASPEIHDRVASWLATRLGRPRAPAAPSTPVG